MEKVFATPTPGVLVRHENGKQLPADGEPVDRNSYWLRRERDGDVTLSEVPAIQETPADPEPTPAPAPSKKTVKA